MIEISTADFIIIVVGFIAGLGNLFAGLLGIFLSDSRKKSCLPFTVYAFIAFWFSSWNGLQNAGFYEYGSPLFGISLLLTGYGGPSLFLVVKCVINGGVIERKNYWLYLFGIFASLTYILLVSDKESYYIAWQTRYHKIWNWHYLISYIFAANSIAHIIFIFLSLTLASKAFFTTKKYHQRTALGLLIISILGVFGAIIFSNLSLYPQISIVKDYGPLMTIPTIFIMLYSILKSRQIITLSYDLSDQVDILRKERDNALLKSMEAIKKTNEKLEEEVQNRTSDLSMANEKLLQSLQEKEILLRELHHRVKNNMQLMIAFLWKSAQRKDNLSKEEIIKEAQNRIKSMSLIHSFFYQSENLGRIEFTAYLHKLVQEYQKTWSSKNINFILDVEPFLSDLDSAISLGMVANEIITNSIKHGFSNVAEGTIRIMLKHNKKNIELSFTDDGCGFKTEFPFEQKGSMGLSLIRDLVAIKMKGEIKIISPFPVKAKNGSKVTVTFPENP